MLRTICSSFLFLIPIYISHKKNDTVHLMLFATAMGISISNHSHTFHEDKRRRKLFCYIDMSFMYVFSGYIMFDTIYRNVIDPKVAIILLLLNYSIYSQLGNGYIESYTEKQKYLHVLFHTTGILSMTVSSIGFPTLDTNSRL